MDNKAVLNRSQSFYLWAVCIALSTYVFIRAWVLLPLHDEVATFVHFIETGLIWGKGSLLDANNHLLNSYLGRLMCVCFGENYFLFRLPNVIAFPFYFWAIWKLTASFSKLEHRWIVLLSIVSIPYIMDYFSYTRGYAMALTFFCWAIVFLNNWIATRLNSKLFALTFVLIASVASNLVYLVPAVLVICFVFLYFILQASQFALKQKLSIVFTVLFFTVGIFPFAHFAIVLKNAGALYYGSLDGFWLVTGTTLCRYVLFYDAHWLKWFVVGASCICFYLVIRIIRKTSIRSYFNTTESITFFLIISNIICIFFLAKIFKVNYPEDRAAMYFIPLVLLTLGSILSREKKLSKLLIVLLFFPISWLVTFNFSTSVFTPDERLNGDFYLKVRKHVQKNTILSVYPLMQLTFASLEKKLQTEKHLANIQQKPLPFSDVVLTKSVFVTPSLREEYALIATDRNSGHVAFKRKVPFIKQLIFDTIASNQYSNNEFIPIYSGKIPNEWKKKPMEFLISGDCFVQLHYKTLNLVVSTSRENNEPITYETLNLRWYHGEKKVHFPIHFPYAAKRITDDEKQLFVYIWNPERSNVLLKNTRVKIIELK